MSKPCMICEKHKAPQNFTGPELIASEAWSVSHFPVVNGELAPRGRVVIETRRHIEELYSMSDFEAAELGRIILKVSKALKEVVKAEHVYVYRINDIVAHLHFHLIPRFADTPVEFKGLKITDWPDYPKANLSEVIEVSKLLYKSIN